jgi:cobalt/nickel transport system permease protein
VLFHLGTIHLQERCQPQSPSFWQQLTPQTRVLMIVVGVMAIALTPNGQWLTWLIYGVGILSLIQIAQVSFWSLGRRLAVELLFVGVAIIGCLFRPGEDVLWQWGWVRITMTGLVVLGSVSCKLLLSLSLLNLLTLTMPIPELLQTLATLRVPPVLVAILAAMYRYVAVLVAEFNALRRAALSRNLTTHQRWQRLVLGNMIGSLFIRTYARGERVHQAMVSRGYQGISPAPNSPKLRGRDWIFAMLCLGLLGVGQAIYWV